MLRSIRHGLKVYDQCIQRRPILVKCITSATLMAVGDSLSQVIEHHQNQQKDKFNFDYYRLGRMTAIGSIFGPLLHYWYGWLDKTITFTGSKGAVSKVVLDQGLFAPAILAFVTVTVGASEGKSTTELKEIMQTSYLTSLKINYLIWPAANFINFNFVPPAFRVLYVSSLSVVWNTILSNILHSSHKTDTMEEVSGIPL